MTKEDNSALKHYLQRQIERKRRELSINQKVAGAAATKTERDAAAAAARRNQKSIALLISKLICDHADITRKYTMPGEYGRIQCPTCKASVRSTS